MAAGEDPWLCGLFCFCLLGWSGAGGLPSYLGGAPSFLGGAPSVLLGWRSYLLGVPSSELGACTSVGRERGWELGACLKLLGARPKISDA